LNVVVDEARSEYRHAIEVCRDRVGQADSLGAANPDASLIRAGAVEHLRNATEKYTRALTAFTDAVIRYRPH
jgi:hypothetical protein